MVWFKVDDKLHSHPKPAAASLAAIGLWTMAGSWCSDHTTDGWVPEHMLTSLSRGAVELADELVAVGLWVRAKSGYRFHQWTADSDGTKRNPTKKEVEEERRKKAAAGRKGGLASGKTRSKRQAPAKAPASSLLGDSLNPRPSPSKEGSGERARASPGAARSPKTDEPHPPSSNGGGPPADYAQLRADALARARAASDARHGRDRRRADPLGELGVATQRPDSAHHPELEETPHADPPAA